MREPTIALGPGREFDLVRALLRAWGESAEGIGDDAAVLDVPPGARLVASVDTAIEGVHFRRGWMTPREVGHRSTAAALSDLAAMGAAPLGILLALTVPIERRDEALAIGEGAGECARRAGAPIVGGDTTAGRELSLTVTVLGSAVRPLRRDGARAGDLVYVTGRLGGAKAALDRLLRGEAPAPDHRARFVSPMPRLAEARWLAAHGAASAVDVSDGLLADLGHIAAASGARIEIDLGRVPCVPGVDPRTAATSGEEYELALTAPAPIDARAFESAFDLPLTVIGIVRASEEEGAVVRCREGNGFVDLTPGYDHFSS